MVLLVNKKDEPQGFYDKFKAHREAKLHRAFSILVFNKKGELLLQQRSKYKLIAPYLWSNACCSHPLQEGIAGIIKEAQKRLKEEMGFACPLKFAFKFQYKVQYGYFFENEVDYVLIGKYEKNPKPNKKEAMGWKWLDLNVLRHDIKQNQEKYTYWLKLILKNNNFKKI